MALPKPYSGAAQPLDTVRPEQPKPLRKTSASTAWERKKKRLDKNTTYPMICTRCGHNFDARSPSQYGERCYPCKRAGFYGVMVSQTSIPIDRIARIKAAHAKIQNKQSE